MSNPTPDEAAPKVQVAGPATNGQPPDGITARAVKGFAWQVASFGGNRLMVFVSTLALARLLVPRDFGVFAAALTFAQYLEVMLDFGVGSYLVYDQEKGRTPRLDVAFTLNLAITVVLTGVVVGVAPLTARLFGAAGHGSVFALMGLYLFLRGWSQVNEALVQRDLLFKKLVIIDLTGALVRAGLSVGLAVAGAGVWSIVVGVLAGQTISTVTAYAVIRYRPRLRFERGLAKEMMKFGGNSVAIDLLTEVSLNGDYLVVGAVLGPTALGIYTIAYRLPELLINNLFWIFSDIAFPVYARSRQAGMDVLRRAMYRALRLTSLYGMAAGVGLAILSRDAIVVFFGPQWTSGIAAMVVLSLAAAFAATTYASGPLFPAIGKPGTLVAVNIPLTVFRVSGFVLAAMYGGIFWVAVVHLVSNVVMVVVRVGITNRVAGTTTAAQLRALLPAAAAAIGVAAGALPARLLMPAGAPSLVLVVVGGVVGAVAVLALVDRSTFGDVRRLAQVLAART
jgi:lipopolysaccharide exporter